MGVTNHHRPSCQRGDDTAAGRRCKYHRARRCVLGTSARRLPAHPQKHLPQHRRPGRSPKVSIDELKNKIDEFEEVSKIGHTHQLWSEVKNKAGLILGCDADEIAYTRNTTEGASIICNGLRLQRGDEVITSTHEHVGNIVSWLARQK